MLEDESEKHFNDIKKSIETLIGAPTSLKKRRKTIDVIKQEKFIEVIESIEKTLARTEILRQFNLDLEDYEESFYQIIDHLFVLLLGEQLAKVVIFYLYDRFDESGKPITLTDEKDNPIPLENPKDLWNYIKSNSPDVARKKK
jgi:hypothetical protein